MFARSLALPAMRLLWLLGSGLAVTLAVLLFPIHTRLITIDWRVDEAYPALRPFVSEIAFGSYVLVWRYAVLALFWAVAGLIAYRRWRSPFGLLVSFVLFILPINFNLAGYTESWLMYPRALRPVLFIIRDTFSFLGLFAFAAMFYLFPNGRAAPRWLGRVGLAIGAVSVAVTLIGSQFFGPLEDWAWLWFISVFLLLLALAVGGQIYRYFRVSSPDERRQTQLVVLALLAFVASLGSQVFGVAFLEALFTQPAISLMELHLQWLMLAALPLSLAVSMLSRGLWGAGPLLNRALVYAALTIIVLGVYILVVGGLGALVNAQDNPLLAVLATGLVAVMFQPLRQRLQRAVNRLMYGDRDDPAAAINRLGKRLEATLAPEAVLPTLTETVAQALRLPYAAIALRQDDTFHLAAEYTAPTASSRNPAQSPGTPPSHSAPLWGPGSSPGPSPLHSVPGAMVSPQGRRGDAAANVVPFIYQGEVIGQLIAAPRAPGERLDPADRRLLEQMARQASPAVHAVRLAADLQRSRERLVTAREEERRRLRRDLHDGVGSTLAALHLQAGGLRALLAGQPTSHSAPLRGPGSPPGPPSPLTGGKGGDASSGAPPFANPVDGPAQAAGELAQRAGSAIPPFLLREGGAGGLGPLAALDDLRAQIRAAVGEIRRVVYDLRPPALDELGLVGAIRARAAQIEQGGEAGPERPVPVTVDAPDTLLPIPAAVEVAAYRIAQEALTNVARHAQAKACRVRLWLSGPEYWAGGGLGLEIEDDGVGLPDARPVGLGLRSMQERAEELGGAFRLLARPGGGTLVSVWLPLPGYTPPHG